MDGNVIIILIRFGRIYNYLKNKDTPKNDSIRGPVKPINCTAPESWAIHSTYL